MRGYSCKEFFKALVALAAFCLTVPAAALFKDPFLLSQAQGATVNKSYYLYSASSWAEEKGAVSFFELPFVEGESVSMIFGTEKEAEAYVKALLESRGATLQKAEFIDGVVSYYAFTGVGESVLVSGLPVDLHVAVKGATVSVGSPVIFGGY